MWQFFWPCVANFSRMPSPLVLLQVPVLIGSVGTKGTRNGFLCLVPVFMESQRPFILGHPSAMLTGVQLFFLPVLVGDVQGQQGDRYKLLPATCDFTDHRIVDVHEVVVLPMLQDLNVVLPHFGGAGTQCMLTKVFAVSGVFHFFQPNILGIAWPFDAHFLPPMDYHTLQVLELQVTLGTYPRMSFLHHRIPCWLVNKIVGVVLS